MSDVTPNSQASSAEAANPVDMISALLDAERVIPDAKPEPAAEPVVKEEVAEPAQNAQVEGDEPPSTEEKEPVAEIPLDQVEAIELEVKYKGDDGKDVVEKKPIKELREGYMRQQDYSRKTAELARQREGAEQTTRQAIEGERNSFQETIKHLQALVLESVAPELKDVNWNDLATNDPFKYVQLRNRAEQIQNTFAQIKAKGEELSVKQKAEQSQALQKVAQQTRSKLEAEIPGFNDVLYQSLIKTGVESGYKPEVVAQWTDPEAFKLLHKAYLYDQLKVGKPAEQKRVVSVPTAIKPGASNPVPATAQRQGKALDNLRKSGSVDALAQFLGASMK